MWAAELFDVISFWWRNFLICAEWTSKLFKKHAPWLYRTIRALREIRDLLTRWLTTVATTTSCWLYSLSYTHCMLLLGLRANNWTSLMPSFLISPPPSLLLRHLLKDFVSRPCQPRDVSRNSSSHRRYKNEELKTSAFPNNNIFSLYILVDSRTFKRPSLRQSEQCVSVNWFFFFFYWNIWDSWTR